jgi:NAD+ diphosphatase
VPAARFAASLIEFMSFVHLHAPQAVPATSDLALAICNDRIVARVAPDGAVLLPPFSAVSELTGAGQPSLHVGLLEGRACWLCAFENAESPAPDGWDWVEARPLLPTLRPGQWQALAAARQLHWWRTRHRFCGNCGTPTIDAPDERAKRCPQCGASFFPSAAPAVIVAVTRNDRLLLARNKNFRSGMFSVLAGFVDPGETIEQAVLREVREEAGIEVGDLRYVTSQPWPFPNSLMLGFRAVHRSGEIVVDGREIAEAGWFARDALPDIPRIGSISRELIEAWRREG